MAHNTRPLQRAQDGIAPQYYNELTDEYEVLQGTAGANHVVIYGPDGQPASLATETKLEAVRLLLQTLDGKAATSQGQADIIEAIGTLAGLVATESGQTAIASAITSLAQAVATETTLDDVKTAAETLAGTVDNGAAKVTLQGSLPPSMMELAVNDWSELPDPTETPKGATAQLIGTFDVRQNNGAEWVEVVL